MVEIDLDLILNSDLSDIKKDIEFVLADALNNQIKYDILNKYTVQSKEINAK